jgi:nucleoside-diphosphate-sugar epimerase
MAAVAALAAHERAYSEHWVVPGPGSITLEQVLDIVAGHLGRRPRVRTAGPLTLRLLAPFMKPLRAFLPMVPHYVQPIVYDGGKLRGLLGEVATTPYQDAIPSTLDWMLGRSGAAA